MLEVRHVVEIRSGEGELVDLFGSDHEPSVEEIEQCLDSCADKGGYVAYVEKTYVKKADQTSEDETVKGDNTGQ